MSKTMTIELFFTKKDEREFSSILKAAFADLLFIDTAPWPAPDPVFENSIDQCYRKLNSGCAILNPKILSIEKYKSAYIYKIPEREEYHGSDIGPGLIQFLHSELANYDPPGLRNGRIASSFEPTYDVETHAFVKRVYDLLRKYSIKVKTFDIKERKVIDKKLARSFYAGPDAIERYDQVNGMYLTNNTMMYFTSKY